MPLLDLSVSATDFGVVNNEGIVFNWQKRMLVFCGGKQVLEIVCYFSKTYTSILMLLLRYDVRASNRYGMEQLFRNCFIINEK